jgi:phage replication-related protein YjqB (UPF0714/DUF867 family)
MADFYQCYADLAAAEPEGVHYRVRVVQRASRIVVLAPHGGRIEPGTSETAALIAAGDFSLYCFESLVSGRQLHITSSRFDEPRGLALVAASDIPIAIHGRADHGDPGAIWMGGLHVALRDAVGFSLARAGFAASNYHHMQGKHPNNICNRSRFGAGVQIELPRSLRNAFLRDADARLAFTAAVRGPILEWLRAPICARRD